MRKRSVLLAGAVGCALLYPAFAGEGGSAEADANKRPQMREVAVRELNYLCGVNSVYMALRLLDKTPDYADICKKLVPRKDSKVSVADIERILGQYGVDSRTFRVAASNLRDYVGGVFIVYTPPSKNNGMGHFHVARILEEGVQIIDPPNPPAIAGKVRADDGERIVVIGVGAGEPRFAAYFAAALIAGGLCLLLCGFVKKGKDGKKN